MNVHGITRIAQELGVHPVTIRRLIKAHSDFPTQKLAGRNAYVFVVEDCKNWLKQYHPAAYKEQLETKEVMVMSDYADAIGVSRQQVQYWLANGMPSKKLLNNIVLIDVKAARQWFLEQKHPRTSSYAEKLRERK